MFDWNRLVSSLRTPGEDGGRERFGARKVPAVAAFCLFNAWVGACLPGHAAEPDAAIGIAADGSQTLDSYPTVAEHLCNDPEYLSCLQVSPGPCASDLRQPEIEACGRGPYLMSDGAEIRNQADVVIPRGMVECVYTAHVALRGLDQATVNRCMAEAKLAP